MKRLRVLRSVGLSLAPWCGGLAAGYLTVTWPVVGAVTMGGGVASLAYWMYASFRSGRRTRLKGRYAVVAILLALSAMLGFASGAGLAAHGSPDPWSGIVVAAVAWAAALWPWGRARVSVLPW